MIILQPTDDAQNVYFRCAKHTQPAQLVVLNTAFGVVLYVTAAPYIDGSIDGDITLPFNDKTEGTKKDIRFFSADPQSQEITDLVQNGPKEYSIEEWSTWLALADENLAIEKEIFRGSVLITSQTNLDKFKLYAD